MGITSSPRRIDCLRRLLRLRPLRHLALAALALAGVGGVAKATWSIVVVDTATGEVAIGCATCLTGFDLEQWVPVMMVGVGGACSQSSIDGDGKIRTTIWDGFLNGTKPLDILKKVKQFDPSWSNRQIGIVDMQARSQTYTGTQCGHFAGGRTGTTGTIVYSIQGNVLTGLPVVDLAEQAILNTSGDLSEKLMAAMEAAASMGGDGRCSCNPSAPDSCGSPPPGFDPKRDKSADCGFMMVSRIGDSDGNCSVGGCSNGVYYLNLNVAFQSRTDKDPVVQLRGLFDAWRATEVGRPDHLLSTKSLAQDHLPGNGTVATSLDLTAIDWQGTLVGHGGATITVKHAAGSAGLAKFGTPVDHNDGTYSVPVTAGAGQGHDILEVVVDDAISPVTLYPFLTLDETETLTSDVASLSAAAGGTVHFSLIGPVEAPPPGYLLLASASGTSPGIPVANVVVPLNLDAVVLLSYVLRNGANFVNTENVLAADGTQSAQFVAKPGELTALIGHDLDFAWLTYGPVTFASNPVVVNVQN
jgi:uncharacterized Ntn-hydrolase superfamily protein